MRALRRPLVVLLAVALLAAAALAAWFLAWRPARDARLVEAHRLAAPLPSADVLSATWFGCTAVLLRAGDDALMIDPFFTRPEGWWPLLRNAEIAPDEARIAEALRAAGVQRLQAVLVSHSHHDHAMDAGVVARLTGAVLAGSRSTANIGRGAGLDAQRLAIAQPGRALQFGPFRVRFIESRHAGATGGAPTGDIAAPLNPPARYLDYRQGGTYSILVEHDQGRVLHHGSAGVVPGALAGLRADLVLLGAALVEGPDAYLRHTVDAVQAGRVVLTHWDDFTRGLERPLRPMPVVVDLAPLLSAAQRRDALEVGFPRLGVPFAVRAGAPAQTGTGTAP